MAGRWRGLAPFLWEDAKSHGRAVKSHGKGVKSHGAAIVSHGRANEGVVTPRLECLVYDLCAWFPLTRDELAQLLHRKSQYVRKLVSAMVGKHLDYTIPDMIRHPGQAYKAIPGHRPGQSGF